MNKPADMLPKPGVGPERERRIPEIPETAKEVPLGANGIKIVIVFQLPVGHDVFQVFEKNRRSQGGADLLDGFPIFSFRGGCVSLLKPESGEGKTYGLRRDISGVTEQFRQERFRGSKISVTTEGFRHEIAREGSGQFLKPRDEVRRIFGHHEVFQERIPPHLRTHKIGSPHNLDGVQRQRPIPVPLITKQESKLVEYVLKRRIAFQNPCEVLPGLAPVAVS